MRRDSGGPRVVVASPSSGPHVRQSVVALDERGMLDYFATTYLDHPDYRLSSALKGVARRVAPRLVAQLERRRFADIAIERIRTKAAWELLRTFSSNVMRRPVLTDAIWERGEHAFDRWVARGLRAGDAVYTYEHAALDTLRAARSRGVHSFYEQPSQHHSFFSRVQDEQLERYPEIANASSALTSDQKAGARNRRRDAELALADRIMCNSSFTRRTLVAAGIDASKVRVTPLGFPPPTPRAPRHDGPVVFLNAGTQNLRKGLHLLYRAWRDLDATPDEAELWLIGRMVLPESLRRDLPGCVRIRDSIPHDELLEVYQRAAVFVLPSLADGFGMVLTEAMSRGLTVITTENTGGPDIIEHGRTGFIVPAGDVDALRSQMRWCIEHRDCLDQIGGRALDAAARWQWSDYRAAFAATIEQCIIERANV
jgi:glycosyltransferase involved in cell wall biosynthesis